MSEVTAGATGVAEGFDSNLGKRQTEAGTVVNGVRQPELRPDEVKRIVNADVVEIPTDIQDLLKKQSNAGIGGNPELTPEERSKIAAYNESRSKTRR